MLWITRALAETGEVVGEVLDAANEAANTANEVAQTAKNMNITFSESLLFAVVGFTVVFIVLVVIICAIVLTSKLMKSGKKAEPAKAAAPVVAAPAVAPVAAPGSCGELKTYNVSDKECAMIMAIVADQMKTPLNELRFISIKEIEK